MFLTCSTYRAATYTPDQYSSGHASSTTGSTVSVGYAGTIAGLLYEFTAVSASTSASANFTLQQPHALWTGSTLSSSAGSTSMSSFTNEYSSQLVSMTVTETTTTITTQNTTTVESTTRTGSPTSTTITATTTGNVFSNTTKTVTTAADAFVWKSGMTASGSTVAVSLGFQSFAAYTISSSSSTSFGSTSVQTSTTLYTYSFFSSTAGASTSTSGSTSTTTTGSPYFTATSITFPTVTTIAQNVDVTSTKTVATTATIPTVNAGSVTTTTLASTITASTISTVSISANTTTSVTIATPTWWGPFMEIGTLVLCTGNTGTNDLAAFVTQGAAGGAPALWNYTSVTQTTFWPAQPTGAIGPAASATCNSTLAGIFTVTLQTNVTVTVIGSSTYTTTTTASEPATFSTSVQGVPIATVTQGITTFSTFTTTQTELLIHPLNTTTSTTATTLPFAVVTLQISQTTVASSRTTYVATVTVTTLLAGYTTVSDAIGLGGATQKGAVSIITAPNISSTTTTFTCNWINGTSGATAYSNSTTLSTSSSSLSNTRTGSTSSGGGTATFTNSTGSTSGQTTFGVGEGFTVNAFAATYQPFPRPIICTNTGTTAEVFATPAAQVWQPAPPMQGFVPWTATGTTYQSISVPAAIGLIPLLPLTTGSLVSFNSGGDPDTATTWGDWALVAGPVTTATTFTRSTTTSTTNATTTSTTANVTLTINATSLLGRSFSYTASGASSTAAVVVSLPVNCDQAAASVYGSTTYTATTAGVPTSTTLTSTASAVGITFTNALTATFAEIPWYTSTSQITASISALVVVTYQTGTAASATTTYIEITSTTLASTVSYSTLFFGSNTVSRPTLQAMPGVGGYARLTSGSASIFVNGAAVSMIGSGGSTSTFSTAFPNFGLVVISPTLTTTSSKTASLAGAGAYTIVSVPGQVSVITSPAALVETGQNKWTPPSTVATEFWLTPNPLLIPAALA